MYWHGKMSDIILYESIHRSFVCMLYPVCICINVSIHIENAWKYACHTIRVGRLGGEIGELMYLYPIITLYFI